MTNNKADMVICSTPNRLNITEEEFNFLYPQWEGRYGFFNDEPPEDMCEQDFERYYLSNKLWRLNNCYKVINKAGVLVRFRMNYAQHKVFAASLIHPRVIILKSRQQGISTFWLICFFDDAMFRAHMNIGLMAQGKDEAGTLLERTKLLWDELSPAVKEFANIKLVKDNATEYAFSNRSTLFIRVSFRSATLQRLHVSELGKIANAYPKRAREVKTGTLQALGRGNTGAIESTAEGKNMFKDMWEDACIALQSGQMSFKDFYPVFLSWLDDPDCIELVDQAETTESKKYFDKLKETTGIVPTQQQRNFWIVQYRELGSDVLQEYPGTPEEAFSATKDGTYYNRLYHAHVIAKGRVFKNLYDPNLKVDVYWDLGVDDYAVLLFVQKKKGMYNIVGEYFNDGYGIEHYLEHIKDRNWDIRNLRFPHDIVNRTMARSDSAGRAMKLSDIVNDWLRKNKLRWIMGRPVAKLGLELGIASTRTLIPLLQLDAGLTYIPKCLQQYTRKYDEKLDVWLPTPVHDAYSHGADTLRGLAVDVMPNHVSRLESGRPIKRSGGFDV